jgi:hypothetical protein
MSASAGKKKRREMFAEWAKRLEQLRTAPSVEPSSTIDGDHFSFPLPGATLAKLLTGKDK